MKSQPQESTKHKGEEGEGESFFLNDRYHPHTWFPGPQLGTILSFIAKFHEFGVPDHRDGAFQWGLYKQFPFAVTDASVSTLKTHLHDTAVLRPPQSLRRCLRKKKNTGTEFNKINLNIKNSLDPSPTEVHLCFESKVKK